MCQCPLLTFPASAAPVLSWLQCGDGEVMSMYQVLYYCDADPHTYTSSQRCCRALPVCTLDPETGNKYLHQIVETVRQELLTWELAWSHVISACEKYSIF